MARIVFTRWFRLLRFSLRASVVRNFQPRSVFYFNEFAISKERVKPKFRSKKKSGFLSSIEDEII